MSKEPQPPTPSTARKKRLDAVHRRTTRELETIFAEDPIDWDAFLSVRVRMEDVNPNFVDPPTLTTTLHRAAFENQFQIVAWCLERRGDVEARSRVGRTPLHMACDGDSVRVVRQLIEHGADANCTTLSLLTPLHISCQSGSYEAVMVLLNTAPIIDVNAMDSKNRSPDLMTSDKRILRLLDRYRAKLDQARKQDLLNHKLQRLFKVFDRDQTGGISFSEWRTTQALMAKYFECCAPQDSMDAILAEEFAKADADDDKAIQWDEFRESAVDLLEAVGMNFNTVMASVADLENELFLERCEEKTRQAAEYMLEVAEFEM